MSDLILFWGFILLPFISACTVLIAIWQGSWFLAGAGMFGWWFTAEALMYLDGRKNVLQPEADKPKLGFDR